MPKKKKKQKKHPLLRELIPKILIYSFIVVAAVQTVSSVSLSLAPEFVNARETMDLNVPIGDYTPTFDQTTAPIAEYVNVIYKYAIGVVGIIAAVVLMWGGVIWLTSAGNNSRVGEAKAWIGSALTGLVLALGSYMILYQVNPDLVAFKPQRISEVEKIKIATNKGQAEKIGNCKTVYIAENTEKDSKKICEKYSDQTKVDDLTQGFSKNYYEESDSSYCKGTTGGKFICCCRSRTAISQRGKQEGLGAETLRCREDLWPDHCTDCLKCEPLPEELYKEFESSFVNENLHNALLEIKNEYSLNWKVTEAWPPTVKHKNSCHYEGTCVDVGFRSPTSYDQKDVELFMDAASGKGLKAVYECPGAGCCADAGLDADGSNCWEDTGDHISGSHFSVYYN